MNILKPTDEQAQYFVDEKEKLYIAFEEENSQSNIDLYVTDSKVYINSEYNKTIQENIIELKAIEYINYAQTKIEKEKSPLTAIAILLVAIGIALFTLFNVLPDITIAAIITTAIGIILLIIGLILNAPKYINQLIIGTVGGTIEIPVEELTPEKVKEIQKSIFKVKASL